MLGIMYCKETNKYIGYIYRIWFDTDKKIEFVEKNEYVGQTKQNLEKRINQHKISIKSNNDGWSFIVEALREFGIDNMRYECLDEVVAEREEELIHELNKKEVKHIEEYNTYRYGLNATLGGDSPVYWYRDNISDEIFFGSSDKRRIVRGIIGGYRNLDYFDWYITLVDSDECKKNIVKFKNFVKRNIKKYKENQSKLFPVKIKKKGEGRKWRKMVSARAASFNIGCGRERYQ